MNSALLIIDIQNDYFENGAMTLEGADQAGQHARLVLEKFRAEHKPVIFMQHIATRTGSTFFLPGTRGVEIHPLLHPTDHEKVIVKHYPNSFKDTILREYLTGNSISALTICGMMTHMCVDATVRAARDFGFRCRVIGDACATRDLEINGEIIRASCVHLNFLAALSGYYAEVITANEYLKVI